MIIMRSENLYTKFETSVYLSDEFPDGKLPRHDDSSEISISYPVAAQTRSFIRKQCAG